MTASSAVEYLPLWQSLIGALGAFAVAAFTVWRSNKHSQNREEKQARRAKNMERQGVLREKLESLVNGCEFAYTNMIASSRHLSQTLEATKLKRPVPPKPLEERPLSTDISTAVVLARIYFPSLKVPVSALLTELSAHSKSAVAAAQAAIDSGNLEGIPPTDVSKAKALRLAVMDEARRLVETDFDLKDE